MMTLQQTEREKLNSEVLTTLIVSVMASSGFWAFLQSRVNSARKHSESTERVLLGLAHEIIMARSKSYITRGWVTTDELEDLYRYLYKPYKDLGGNGSAERIVDRVNNLQIRVINHDHDK